MQTNHSEIPDSLTASVSNEIITPSIDLAIEYAELGLDEFLTDGILKEIPIIKSLYSVGKLGFSVKERFFVKKLFTFLKEFHTRKIDEDKINDFKEKFDANSKYRNKVTEHLIVYLDALLGIDKAKIFANLFRAHIQGYFEWEHFLHLSSCLNAINPKAFPFLIELSKYNFEIAEEPSKRTIERNGENEALLYSCGIAYETSSWSSAFNISELGIDLAKYGLT